MQDKKVNRIINIEFDTQQMPDMKPVKNGDYIAYGKDNDYPSYLLSLSQQCAEHNAILKAKEGYVFGKGLSYIKTNDPKIDAKLEAFIESANQFENWNTLLQKTINNYELIDGYYWQLIFGKNGKIVSVYSLDITRIRRSACGTGFYYCEDWTDRKKINEKKFYPEYNPNVKTGTCIYYRKTFRASPTRFGDTYAIPNYIGALSAIETDINIDTHFNSLTKYGMTAQGMLTLFNGIPLEDEQKEIVRKFRDKYTGAKNAGSFMLNFADPDGKEAMVTNFGVSDQDKQFEILGKRVIQKICSGHRIDPVLIGIDTATSWDRPQLLNKWERFQNEYVNPRQKTLLEDIKMIAQSQGVAYEQLFIEDLPPLGEELDISESTLKDILTVPELRAYVRDKKNVQLSSLDDDSSTSRLSVAQKLGVGGTATLQALLLDTTKTPEQKLPILTNLYGIPKKKAQDMLGIVVAPVLDAEGNPVAMSAVKDDILEAFLKCAIDLNDDEVLETKFLEGNPSEFEQAQVTKFEEVLGATVKAVRNQILDLLAGDPNIKLEIIAKQLGTDVAYVEEQILALTEEGILEKALKGFNLTEKGLNRAEKVEPVVETEIYTVYQYAVRPGLGSDIIPTSREFCVDMINLSNKGKVWTREAIDGISNEFGDNAWIYRGGFYNNGKDTTPYCRHLWKAITKVRRKNG